MRQPAAFISFNLIAALIIFFSLLSLTACLAQQPNFKLVYSPAVKGPIKETQDKLATQATDTGRVYYQLLIAETYLDLPGNKISDIDSASLYLKRALQLARQARSKKYIHLALLQYANYFMEAAKPQLAELTYKIALANERGWKNQQLEAETRWFYYFTSTRDYGQASHNKAIAAYQLIKSIATTREEKLREAALLKDLADWHLIAGKLDLACTELFEVISIQKKYHSDNLKYTYDLLAGVYKNKGELSTALSYALRALQMTASSDLLPQTAFCSRIAEIHAAVGNHKETEYWYSRAYRIADKKSSYLCYTTEAYCAALHENGKSALALEITKETWKNKQVKTDDEAYLIRLMFAECYHYLKHQKLAEHYYRAVRDYYEQKKADNELRTEAFLSLAKYYISQHQNLAAQVYLNRVKRSSTPLTLYQRMTLAKLVSDIELALGKPAAAVQDLHKYIALRDSIFTEQRLLAAERLRVQFHSAQKEKENELLKRKSQLQDQQIQQAGFVRNTIIVGAMVLAVIVVMIYSRFRLKSRVNRQLLLQKNQVDQANHELGIAVAQKNKLLKDKEELIKEVHHRVKNNLQLTMSLLSSQSYYLEDKSAREAIEQSQHRLKSIALIHQKLYQTENIGLIDVKPYILDLLSYLTDALSDKTHIRFEINLLSIEMDISRAVSLGLFINEAVTNIYKYAFPEKSSGLVVISLTAHGNDSYRLLISDNGIGLPANIDQLEGATLGFTLMNGLSEQLEAVLNFTNESGLTITLIFSNHSIQQPAL
jgi:two-component sensor histidine kinase